MANNAGIRSIIERSFVAVSPDASVAALEALSDGSNVDFLPVVEEGRLIGTVDMLKRDSFPAGAKTVRDVMAAPKFIKEDSTPEQAVRFAIAENLHRIAVIDSIANMRCVGIISSTELLRLVKSR